MIFWLLFVLATAPLVVSIVNEVSNDTVTKEDTFVIERYIPPANTKKK